MCANENSGLLTFLCFCDEFFLKSIGIVDTSYFRQMFILKENLKYFLSCQLLKATINLSLCIDNLLPQILKGTVVSKFAFSDCSRKECWIVKDMLL